MKKTEAIVLKTQSLRERDQILTLFSRDRGIIQCVFKGLKTSNQRFGGVCNPLTRAEFILSGRNPDLMKCEEVTILSHYLEIRKHLEKLESACQMLLAIKKTQLQGKAAPLLFTLLIRYLDTLANTQNPEALSHSFFLKLFHHEGRLSHLGVCCSCNKALESLYLSGGEGFCKTHSKPGSFFIGQDELGLILVLLYSRKISDITNVLLPPALQEKLKFFFEQLLHI